VAGLVRDGRHAQGRTSEQRRQAHDPSRRHDPATAIPDEARWYDDTDEPISLIVVPLLLVLARLTTMAGLDFPHATQALRITRRARPLGSRRWRTVTVYAITSLTAAQASPARLADWIRGH
jgi:hypothetical protein